MRICRYDKHLNGVQINRPGYTGQYSPVNPLHSGVFVMLAKVIALVFERRSGWLKFLFGVEHGKKNGLIANRDT